MFPKLEKVITKKVIMMTRFGQTLREYLETKSFTGF